MAALAADFAPVRRSDWTLPVAAYGVYALVCVFALHPTALQMAATWFSSSSYHHGAAVPLLAALMIFERPRFDPSTAPVGLLGVIASVALWLAGHAAGVALIEQVAFVSLLIAGAGVMFGATALRLWAMPLLFLYFMVPFGEVLIPFLQNATAHMVVSLLTVFDIPAAMDGVLIETPAGRFEIAEACAGLNFLLAALMIACVYGCLVLNTFRARLGFLIIAATVAIVANMLRAFLLIVVATLTEMRFAVGPDHLVVGLVFYGLVFAILFWIGAKMRAPQSVGPEHAPITARRPWRSPIAVAALVPILAAAAYAALIVDRTPSAAAPAQLSPLSASGWRLLGAPENWTPKINADRVAGATYQKGADRVYVSIGYFTHDRTGREIVNALNAPADGADWRKIATADDVVYLFGRSEETPLEILAGPERRRLLVAALYWRGGEVYTDKMQFKFAQLSDKPKGHNPPGGIVMIASDYAGEPSAALARIRAFTSDVESLAAWRARNGAS